MGLTDWFFSMPMFWVLCLIVAGGLIFAAVYYVRNSLTSQLVAHAHAHEEEGKISLFFVDLFFSFAARVADGLGK
jgi:cobalamin biosynthesis protein CobD/CbiB